MKRKITSIFISIMIVFTSYSPVFAATAAKDMNVYFIDVGQGDSILIKSENKTMLVDSGPSSASSKLVEFLKSKNVKKIDYLVATHPDADHIGSMVEVLENFKVVNDIITTSRTSSSKTYKNFVSAAEDKSLELIYPPAKTKYQVGDASISVLYNTKASNNNDSSVVLRVNCGKNSLLLTGDISSKIENKLISDNVNVNTDILKVAYHGSKYSSDTKFLNKVTPTISVISCAKKNSYGHPHKEALTNLSKAKSKIYGTYDVGTVTLTIIDGRAYVNGNRFPYYPKNFKAKGRKVKGKARAVITFNKNNTSKKYQVYRSTKKDGKYTRIATITKNKYIDKKIKKKKTYYYKVRSFNSPFYSAFTKKIKVRVK